MLQTHTDKKCVRVHQMWLRRVRLRRSAFFIVPDILSEESTAADGVLCAAVLAGSALQHCGKFLNR